MTDEVSLLKHLIPAPPLTKRAADCKPKPKEHSLFRGSLAILNMQSIRNSILRHLRLRASIETGLFVEDGSILKRFCRQMCGMTGESPDQIMDRVIGLVKKFDKIDATKVTETADFQKDLCLDSLDRVELVMAFEQEFSIEISDENADKLTCCADVAKYIAFESEQKVAEKS